MDPYLLIENGQGQKFRTPTAQDIGKNPKWNHTIEVLLDSLDDTLRISVYDEDIISDALVGEENYMVNQLVGKQTAGKNQNLSINFKGKKAGEVTINCSLTYIEKQQHSEDSSGNIKLNFEDNNKKGSRNGDSGKSSTIKEYETPGTRKAQL